MSIRGNVFIPCGEWKRQATRSHGPRVRKVFVAVLGLAAAVTLAACTPPSNPTNPQSPTAGTAANRIIFWTKCGEVVGLTDAELDTWRDRGVGGFVCRSNYLYALGGSQDFTGDPASTPSGSTYNLQRQIRDSQIVEPGRGSRHQALVRHRHG